MKRIEIDTARGKERVPPGQYLVGDRWPILTYGPTPQFSPRLWDFRVRGIELLAEDKPGFWENNGYHNYGDLWKEQRYSFSF